MCVFFANLQNNISSYFVGGPCIVPANHDSTSKSAPPPTPAKPDKTCLAVANNHSSPALSTSTTRTRPKEPPPPLPKTPPSSTPKTVQKTPSVTKTPPPLPKTPPRGSVKQPSSNSSRQSSFDSPERQTKTGVTDTTGPKMTITERYPENNIRQAKGDMVNDSFSCDSEDINSAKSDKEKESFANIKSRFNSSVENVATERPTPKVPLKPKAKVLERNKASPKTDKKVFPTNWSSTSARVEENDSGSECKSDSSVWFVNTDSEEAKMQKPEPLSECADKNSAIQFIKGTKESSIKFKNAESPSHSPVVPRKPLPTPPKSQLSRSTENVMVDTGADDNSLTKDKSNVLRNTKQQDSHKGSNEDLCNISESTNNITKDSVNIKDSEAEVVEVKSFVDSEVPETNTDFRTNTSKVPTPLPRKVVAAVRPRPMPRKRTSLTRNSGGEETFERNGNVPDISNDIAQSDNCDTNEGISKSECKTAELDNETVCRRTEISDVNDVTKRVIITDTGEEEQYRVIDRSSIRSGSHITELDDDHDDNEDGVILRKKTVRSDTFDIQDVPSVEELTAIFGDSDAEDNTADDSVPNTCLSKDFGFGDKFLTFSKENLAGPPENSSKIEDKQETNTDENFEDLMSDNSILEPSSLLNEIEDILTRSFKHSSLTRSGSSPEKKSSPYMKVDERFRSERSKSVDTSSSTPVRPPRPKKEQRRLRSMSQAAYDSCGSDTESLPDIGRSRLDSQSSNLSMTLGKAKPHPPKPKRNKLLKVQRSQSDVTAMRSLIDKMETAESKSPQQRTLASKLGGGTATKNRSCDISKSHSSQNMETTSSRSDLRKNRPTRKAPPPPRAPPFKVTPPSPSMDLNKVVPLDERVKSMNLNKQNLKNSSKEQRESHVGHGADAVKDEVYYSDLDHDYQDISDSMDAGGEHRLSKLPSPPKLPPRNMNSSHSFDRSSLSSAGHVASSAEDVSVSSGGYDPDVNSPGFKNHPKTSSPLLKGYRGEGSPGTRLKSALGPSSLSLSSGGEKSLRPVSGCSFQSDSWSGSHEAGLSSSSDSDLDEEEKVCI